MLYIKISSPCSCIPLVIGHCQVFPLENPVMGSNPSHLLSPEKKKKKKIYGNYLANHYNSNNSFIQSSVI